MTQNHPLDFPKTQKSFAHEAGNVGSAMRKRFRLYVAFLVVASLGFATSACAQEKILVWDGEVAAQYASSAVRLNGPNGESVATVNRGTLRRIVEVKNRIAEAAKQPAHLYIVSGTEPNAFATKKDGSPQIAINVAMIDLLGDDYDAYAAIIGHELAHLVRDHSATRESREGARSAISSVLGTVLGRYGIPLGGTIANIGTTAVSRTFSRDEEREADSLGLGYMKQAGYDPMGGVRAWEHMGAVAKSRGLPFLSTHPAPEERLETMRALAQKNARPGSVSAAPQQIVAARNSAQTIVSLNSIVVFVNTERIFKELKGRFSDNQALLEMANRTIRRIAEKGNIDIVFQKAVWASPQIDISDDIINEVEGKSADYDKLRNLSRIPQKVGFVDTKRVFRDSQFTQDARKRIDAGLSSRDLELKKALEVGNRVIRQIAEGQDFTIIFEEAVYASPGIDITAELIRRMQ